MKVITEEEAIYFRNHLAKQDRNIGACAIDELIAGHSEEIDTLTVSQLRPMADAIRDPDKRYKKFLFKRIDRDGLDQGQFDTSGNVWMNGNIYYPDELEGWAEFPIYKPEKE